MNKGLKNKGLGSWFCLAAALVALITGIVFLSTQATAAPLGHSGTMPGVVLLVGAAASLVFFFVSVPFSALIQAVIYNIALYLVVVQLYFVFADVINHVTFAGGNAGLCVFYMVGTFVACMSGMAFNPVPFNFTALTSRIEELPKIWVFNVFPVFLFPTRNPLGNATFDIG